MKTILLIEDDENLNYGISLKLSKEGYHVLSAFSLSEGESLFHNNVDLVIADITLPDGNGIAFGKKIRSISEVYLIYLTACDQEIDIVNGYDSGADDYITKPFSVTILLSKVNALMRRVHNRESNILISGNIEVSLSQLQAKKDGMPLNLSKTELHLLFYLLENAGQILTKESILEKIWGNDGQFVAENTVTVNISRLKNKLCTDSISNVRGLGYIWTGEVFRK